MRDKNSCDKCNYLSVECLYIKSWWVCRHPKYYSSGHGYMDLEIDTEHEPTKPSWCPLERECL
jgi:ribosomal protein L37AE/L43A